jgi:hypothetical protein
MLPDRPPEPTIAAPPTTQIGNSYPRRNRDRPSWSEAAPPPPAPHLGARLPRDEEKTEVVDSKRRAARHSAPCLSPPCKAAPR